MGMDTRRGTCQEEGPLIAKSPWKSCHSVFRDPVASSSSGQAQKPRVVDSIERLASSAHQNTKLLPIASLGKQCKVRSRFESWGSTDTPLAAWPDLHPHPLSTTLRPTVPAPEAIGVTSASQKQKPLLGWHSSASCEPACPYPLQTAFPFPAASGKPAVSVKVTWVCLEERSQSRDLMLCGPLWTSYLTAQMRGNKTHIWVFTSPLFSTLLLF